MKRWITIIRIGFKQNKKMKMEMKFQVIKLDEKCLSLRNKTHQNNIKIYQMIKYELLFLKLS